MIAAANLHAFNYGIKGNSDVTLFKKVLDGVKVPEFVPKSGLKIQVSETDAPAQNAPGKFRRLKSLAPSECDPLAL